MRRRWRCAPAGESFFRAFSIARTSGRSGSELGQEGAWGEDPDTPKPTERQQVLVTGHDHIGPDGNGRRDHVVVVRITADGTDFGQLAEKYGAAPSATLPAIP